MATHKNMENFVGDKTVDDEVEVHVESSFDYDRRAYYIMVLLGVGVLLPWNVILNTLDFLDNKFPNADLDVKVTPAYVWVQLPLLGVMVKVRARFVLASRLAVSLCAAPPSWATALPGGALPVVRKLHGRRCSGGM